MRKALIIALNLVALALLAWHFLAPKEVPKHRASPPPEFTFTDLSGQKHRMSEFKGRVTLLHFWASWCAPCVEELPQLIALAQAQPGLTIVALSVDESKATIKKFLGDRALPENFFVVWDKEKRLTYDLFQTINYPETILVGCDYTLKGKVIGMAQDWPATVAPLLSDCAAGTSDAPRPALPPAAG